MAKRTPANIKGRPGAFPVINVTWEEAGVFCNKLSEREGRKYRLPTAMEWEDASRGGKTSTRKVEFPPNVHSLTELAWYNDTITPLPPDSRHAQPVAGKKANSAGLFDMYGNVREWCQDAVHNANGQRAVRGGGWRSDGPAVNSSEPDGFASNRGDTDIGFRVVTDEAAF